MSTYAVPVIDLLHNFDVCDFSSSQSDNFIHIDHIVDSLSRLTGRDETVLGWQEVVRGAFWARLW